MRKLDELIVSITTASERCQFARALSLANIATEQFPDDTDTWILNATLHQQAGQLRAARHAYEQAYVLRADDPGLIRTLCNLLEELDAYTDSLELLDSAITRLPQDDGLLMARADISAKLGDFKSSVDMSLKVLQRSPDHIGAICTLAGHGYTDELGGLAGMEKRLSNTHYATNEYNRLSYAYACMLEQDGKYDKAFAVYTRANAQRAAVGGMDIVAKQKGAQAVIDELTPEIIQRFSGRGNRSERPVFIVGMPRSGTTLTEQILASHPDIYAGGERLFWPSVLRGLIANKSQQGSSLLECIDNTHANVWNHAGTEYLQRIGEINDHLMRVTDKLPANFALLPYIRLVFPQAHIIHLKREPLASIASCIRTQFDNPALAFSVEDWARFYGIYLALMDHWRPVLGEQLLELDYEDLVRDLPGQSRRLVTFIGLEWNEACLHPELNTRAVNTASVKQVRQSVHTGAINAWRRYEIQLEALRPLIAESRASLK